MADLFESIPEAPAPKKKQPPPPTPTDRGASKGYTAADIEVLEGLEPVRKRPGMYIGGIDERAYHHLAAEILDNAMDEAVAGHANKIWIHLESAHTLAITDNGRGIPVDMHPKHKKPALEVIMTTLHSGGKFSNKAYQTSGGLHGVGISVVNALSEVMEIEVARDQKLYKQTFSKGLPTSDLQKLGAVNNRRGTKVTFTPDPEIFGETLGFNPARLFQTARAKAYLYKGVEINWSCNPDLLVENPHAIPDHKKIHFPNGLKDFLNVLVEEQELLIPPFSDTVELSDGKVEWAFTWPVYADGLIRSYCNTVPTHHGGTHENGLRAALTKAVRSFGELANLKKATDLTADDVMGGAICVLSVFIPNPQFQGQTKEKLGTHGANRLVDNAIKDRFEQYLSSHPALSKTLLEQLIERMEERKALRKAKETKRKTATRRLRLPGKLIDCIKKARENTELFIVEGDSAGGSAKQARNPKNQAVLPLRGKILNVASATKDKMLANKELSDLILAMGCGWGKDFKIENLRYDRIIIMTDADVDGAHISSLLMTFFYLMMPKLIEKGHLFLALPPLYRLVYKDKTMYAQDDSVKDALMAEEFPPNAKVEISRFKGLGEMPPRYLKETTMAPQTRQLVQVALPDLENVAELEETRKLVQDLMGKDSQPRFDYIQSNAKFVEMVDI